MVIGTPTVLNLIPGGVMKVIHVNQVNENIEIQFRIMNGAQPFNVPEGVSCTIRGTKGDNFGYAADVAVTAGSNIVTVTLTEQLTAVAGAGNIFELVFVGASDDMKVSTENFILAVERAALGENTVISDSDLAYADQVLNQLQSVGAVNAQVQQNKANIAAEITRATAAEQTLQQNINAEAAARQAADNTLQSNINAEASSRATTDASLQSQINQLVAPSGSAPSAAEVENARIGSDGTVYPTLGDAIRTQNSLLKSQMYSYLENYSEAISIRENIASEIIPNKIAYYANGKLQEINFNGRGYVSVPVMPGHRYACYPAFANSYSYFGKLGESNYAMVSDYTSNGIITAPSGFTMMYLANDNWQNEGFSVVVIESDYRIDGYTTSIYPNGSIEKVEIPKLFDLNDTRKIVGIEHLRNWVRGNGESVDGNPIPTINSTAAYLKQRITTEPYNLININAGDIIDIADGFSAYVCIYYNNVWVKRGWISGKYTAPNTGICFIVVRYTNNAEITNNDEIMDSVTIYRKGNVLERTSDETHNIVKAPFSALGVEQYEMVIGNFDVLNNNPVPVSSSYMADRFAITPIGYPLTLNAGDTVVVDDDSLSYACVYYNLTNNRWVDSGWITGGTNFVAPATSDYYYIKIRKTNNSAIESINDLVNFYCIIRVDNYSYVNNQIVRNKNNIDKVFDIIESVSGALLQLPDYYHANNWIENKVSSVRSSTNILHGVCFEFITDMHFKSNAKQSKYLLKGILESTTISLVLCGGDIPALPGTSEELYEQVKTLVDYQNYIGKDSFFTIRGNHDFYNDDNSVRTTLTEKQTYNALLRNCERSTVDMLPEHMCYVVEDNAQNTIYLMMNSKDSNSAESKITGTQAKWIANELLKYKDRYIIAVSHIPSDDELTGYDAAQEIIQTLLVAFNGRSTVNITHDGTAISVDYGSATGKVVFHLSGHDHKDESSVADGVLSIVTTCDAYYQDDGESAVVGTVTEQAIDVFCVDYDAKIVNAIRVGRGNNRSWDISGILT